MIQGSVQLREGAWRSVRARDFRLLQEELGSLSGAVRLMHLVLLMRFMAYVVVFLLLWCRMWHRWWLAEPAHCGTRGVVLGPHTVVCGARGVSDWVFVSSLLLLVLYAHTLCCWLCL